MVSLLLLHGAANLELRITHVKVRQYVLIGDTIAPASCHVEGRQGPLSPVDREGLIHCMPKPLCDERLVIQLKQVLQVRLRHPDAAACLLLLLPLSA